MVEEYEFNRTLVDRARQEIKEGTTGNLQSISEPAIRVACGWGNDQVSQSMFSSMCRAQGIKPYCAEQLGTLLRKTKSV